MNQEGRSTAASVDVAVASRYAAAAREPEAALCCEVEYSADFLSAIPEEISAKDYGIRFKISRTGSRRGRSKTGCDTSNPPIPDASADCVVSNCVLNLVRPRDRQQLFAEVFRVLRRGGRAAISNFVAIMR